MRYLVKQLLLEPVCSLLYRRDGRQAQVELNQQATDRRLLASALAARTNKIKGNIESIKGRLSNPEPGTDFVQSLATALDAGEQQITNLKQEQRQKYDALTKEVSNCLFASAQQKYDTSAHAHCWQPTEHQHSPPCPPNIRYRPSHKFIYTHSPWPWLGHSILHMLSPAQRLHVQTAS